MASRRARAGAPVAHNLCGGYKLLRSAALGDGNPSSWPSASPWTSAGGLILLTGPRHAPAALGDENPSSWTSAGGPTLPTGPRHAPAMTRRPPVPTTSYAARPPPHRGPDTATPTSLSGDPDQITSPFHTLSSAELEHHIRRAASAR
ncbi:hypothetical protein BU26DRAFT_583483 [Trematosphaeria pertusa]|uniref:Uncharacterized protein n=1 Tax=Trematosphaeria pertusa TaxID=390896 RepID=A0A6A6J0A8_9PLEO|nr:uncharacterized protein BU26DRAFT_583483 [Trematosphaeria pertusa]KAF2254833.1 hypothetical protein BU26DRAFT_583483 [Trematosphaeria pertusa]